MNRATVPAFGNLLDGRSSNTSPGSTFLNRILTSTKVKFHPLPHHHPHHAYHLPPNHHHPYHRQVDLSDELEAGKCRTGDCRLNFSDLDDVFSFPGPLVVKTTLDVSTANGNLS